MRAANNTVMCRRWLGLVLALGLHVPAAWAQPASPGVTSVQATMQAQSSVGSAERRVAQLDGQRAALAQRYAAQTEEVERLKKQKRSWRTDRQLQVQLAEAKETAD